MKVRNFKTKAKNFKVSASYEGLKVPRKPRTIEELLRIYGGKLTTEEFIENLE